MIEVYMGGFLSATFMTSLTLKKESQSQNFSKSVQVPIPIPNFSEFNPNPRILKNLSQSQFLS